jgi:hypothetical protein
MYTTSQDLSVIYNHYHQLVARELGIDGYEWLSASELVDVIRRTHPTISAALEDLNSKLLRKTLRFKTRERRYIWRDKSSLNC